MSVRTTDPAFEAWIAAARAVSVETAAEAVGFVPARGMARGTERAGPCPRCGGHDGFAFNLRKQAWNCRKGGAGGHDGIGLVMHAHGLDFLDACERLAGPRPERRAEPDWQARHAARLAEIQAERAKADAERERQANRYRDAVRLDARRLWLAREKLPGTASAAYLVGRGIDLPPGLRLGHAETLAYTVEDKGADGRRAWRTVFSGPALLAPIVGPDGRQIGTHRTWIDPARPGRKAALVDPETGEALPAKKVLGSVGGGAIELAMPAIPARRMIVGEGIETVLSVWTALARTGSALIDGTLFRSAVSLGNLAGRAEGRCRVRHPTLTMTDKAGRVRPVMVGGDRPDMASDAMAVPAGIEEVILLGDGDSDRFATELMLRRAARRMRAAGLRVRLAWAAEGGDFNDMMRDS